MATLAERIAAKQRELTIGDKHDKPIAGKVEIRILPSWRGPGEDFWQDWGIHWVKNPGDDKAKAVHMCLAKTFGEPCPICDALDVASRTASDDLEIQAIKDSSASQRFLFNVINITKNGPDSDPVIFEVPMGLANEIFSIMGDFGDITDLENGHNLIINGTGEGMKRKYSATPKKDPSKVSKAQAAKVANLDEHVQQQNQKKMMEAINAVNMITGVVGSSSPAVSYDAPKKVSHMPSSDFDDDFEMPSTPAEESPFVGDSKVESEDEKKARWLAEFKAEMAGS